MQQDILHSIKYNIINEQNKNFVFKVYINDNLKLQMSEKHSITNKIVTFTHQYEESDDSSDIEIKITGEEQHHKLLQVKNIIINKQPINILGGFYYVDENDWWESLDPEEYKKMKKKTVIHGANFGWFGTVEYRVALMRNHKRKPRTSVDLNFLPRLESKGIFI